MRVLQKLTGRSPQSIASHATTQNSNSLFSMRTNSGRAIAGVFLCTGLITAVTVAQTASASPDNGQTEHHNATVEVKQSASNKATNAPTTDTAPNITASTTNTNQGAGSTQVTVNGQPIEVPANGTTRQTLTTPNGSTVDLQVSHSQITTGSSSNVTVNSSSIVTTDNSTSAGSN